MREILFRGKRQDNGEWVYGVPTKDDFNATFIVQGIFECDEYRCSGADCFGVDEITIGQYTGLTANGKKIFEGDIVNFPNDKIEMVVCFDDYSRFMLKTANEAYYLLAHLNDYCEVIGNIHDNPELLKSEVQGE